MCKCHETTFNCDQGRACPARRVAPRRQEWLLTYRMDGSPVLHRRGEDLIGPHPKDNLRVDTRRIRRWFLGLLGAWGLLATALLFWSGR